MAMESIRIELITESPLNPRKHFDPAKMAELTQSIKERGVDTPVLVRPDGPGYQLVSGHRRRRAAIAAGLPRLPCIVRELTDPEARIAALVENGQREDVHPLDEADAYLVLQKQDGLSVHQIADQVGKSIGYVYGRLRLCGLVEEPRQALWDGRLTPTVALIIARLPPSLQPKATEEILEDRYRGPMGAKEAAEHVRNAYMLRLVDAPFDRGDAALVPGAGPCTTCPKRTGVQPELFADVDSPDLCTDPDCFEAKKDAVWARRVVQAQIDGRAVLPDKDAKKYFVHWTNHGGENDLTYSAPFEDLNAKCEEDDKGRTYAELLGAKAPPVTLARDPGGKARELVDKKELQKALKKAGVKARVRGGEQTGDNAKWQKEQAEREQTRKLRGKVIEAVVPLMVQEVELQGCRNLRLWRLVVEQIASFGGEDVLERRGAIKEDQDQDDGMKAYLATLSLPQVLGLVFEMSIGDALGTYGDDYNDGLQALCEVLAIDLPALCQRLGAPAPKLPEPPAPPEPEPAVVPAKKRGRPPKAKTASESP